MGCAQVSAASQRHPTAPLPAKRPPCSTPTALATGLAPPQCSRTLPAKGGCEETRRTPLPAAARRCPPLPARACGCGPKGRWVVLLRVRLECASGRDATMAGTHRSSPNRSLACRARAKSRAEQRAAHHGPSASFITAKS